MEQWKQKALDDAVHVDKRAQLPGDPSPARFEWTGGGSTAKGTERQILEHLMRRPIYCASRMNLSAYIDRLRQEHGAPITTYYYTNPETGGRFGVYALTTRVEMKEFA